MKPKYHLFMYWKSRIFRAYYWCRSDINSLEKLTLFELSKLGEHHRLISIEIVSHVVNTIMSSMHFRSALMGPKLSKKPDNINKSCTLCSSLLLNSMATTPHTPLSPHLRIIAVYMSSSQKCVVDLTNSFVASDNILIQPSTFSV